MPYLWLCPAAKINLDATILNSVPFETLAAIDAALPEWCRARYAQDAQGFHCWAMGGDRRSRSFFNTYMRADSVCLFRMPGAETFQFAARVLATVKACPCAVPDQPWCNTRVGDGPGGYCHRRASTIQLATELWPAAAEGPNPWELIFFTTPATPVEIPRLQLVQAMGWDPRYAIPFTRPVFDIPQVPRHSNLLHRIGSLPKLWDDILNERPIGYLYANPQIAMEPAGQPLTSVATGPSGGTTQAHSRVPDASHETNRHLIRRGYQPIQGQEWRLLKSIDSPFPELGEVWLAEDPTLQRQALFKFCHSLDDHQCLVGLENEVAKLRVLTHEGIVAITAASLKSKPPFLQFEHATDSYDLKTVLDKYHEDYGERINPDDASHVIRAIAEPLAYCHCMDTPLVHRGINPGNILVLDYELLELVAYESPLRMSRLRYKLLDFSLAAHLNDGHGNRGRRSGYESPQQYAANEGYRPRPADDVFSLGALWWQLLTGRRPSPETSTDVFAEGLRDVHLADPLKEILLNCVQSHAAERISDAATLARALDQELNEAATLITELFNETAQDEGVLKFDGCRHLSRRTAKVLLRENKRFEEASRRKFHEFAGGLYEVSFDNLVDLDTETADVLAQLDCVLCLNGSALNTESARALAAHVCGLNVTLPDDFAAETMRALLPLGGGLDIRARAISPAVAEEISRGVTATDDESETLLTIQVDTLPLDVARALLPVFGCNHVEFSLTAERIASEVLDFLQQSGVDPECYRFSTLS
jgi:serine/threonine protein kinase